ncbi:MAG TPA: DEAD/DEAH box helicase [Acidimicrobiia bacterium]|nr:DEAD/DEAH box helicase [Acidimicrobiia bacterium]
MDPLDHFHAPTAAWFRASFPAPTLAQEKGWRHIAAGSHTLIHAPTGSGKTLAAFLWVLDRLLHEPAPLPEARCRVLYISPMKALAYDVDRNLRAPLAGIRHAATRLGQGQLPELATFLRTGDTPAADRQRMLRNPPDILITTPESLFLLLTSEARKVLASVRWVIVDEVHAVASQKRGAHLAVSLERLEELTAVAPQRIGLSATQRPLETIAEYLGGGTLVGEDYQPRSVEIADAPAPRPLDLEVIVPVEDMSAPAPIDPLDPEAPRSPSIWPAIYPEILELIKKHRSTIVFANSRRLAERICAQINELAGEEISRAHHGSVSREQRIVIEESLKRGDLRAVVATSSLELGIDMGAVDLVIQVEAPVSVASGLQRVGRSGHHVGGESRARILPKYRGDLLTSVVVARQMLEGDIEETVIPRNPLDVLSQQLVAAVVTGPRSADELYDLVRRARPFSTLTRPLFDATLDMLAGRYPSDLFAELRARVNWDRIDGTITARPGARQLVVANAGTIPDRGLFRVVLPDGSRVGELDEEMVYESRVGDAIVLGASTWRVADIGPERVEVIPDPGAVGARLPFWKGDVQGRSLATGRRIGRFVREMGRLEDPRQPLMSDYNLDEFAATNLAAYLAEEKEAIGLLPTDQTLVLERFRDEIGDWRVALLSPLGARIHAPWAMALTQKLRSRFGTDVDVIWADDGIAFRFPDSDEVPGLAELTLEPEEVRELLEDHLADTALFGARFREAAGRALLLPRRRPGSRTPLWQQRRRAADLLAVARQFGSFPIMLETYREILTQDFDLPALTEVLSDLQSRKLRIVEVETTHPSPFASSLLFAFVAAFLYEADTPLAERRATALTLDRNLLANLLGEGELADLISPDVVAMVELELQHLTPERRATSADGVVDLLRDLGPLSKDDIEVRSDLADFSASFEELLRTGRMVAIRLGGRQCYAASEDISRLRDGLGIPPPPGTPKAFLEPVLDPLGDLVGRYARTHGPLQPAQVASALGLPTAVVESSLRFLAEQGRVLKGSFHRGEGWVDTEVLRRIKRRSLAELRHEIEPTEPASLGRFTPAWQGAGNRRPARIDVLADVVTQLQGYEAAASVWEREILSARVGEAPALLDRLLMDGEILWAGRGTLGGRDGKLALYRRKDFARLWFPIEATFAEDGRHDDLRNFLAGRGASFFYDMYQSVGGDPGQVLEDLWDLVWGGLVTNDSLAPVRAYIHSRAGRRAPGRRPLPSSFPAHAGGRWSLLPLVEPDPTAAAAAWADVLLSRYGVLTRAHVGAEGVPGGYTRLYPVLSKMEEIGKVRRGYFIEGLGGAQFALPGAVDRLRGDDRSQVLGLAATDPANPYGAALPWPEREVRFQRAAGAYVVLGDGNLLAYLDRGGRRLALLTDGMDSYGEIAREVAAIAGRQRRMRIERIDDHPAQSAPFGSALTEWGFVAAPQGLAYRG